MEKESEEESEEVKEEAKEETSSIPLPMTVPFEKVSQMLDDANNLQQVMDDRNKKVEKAVYGR